MRSEKSARAELICLLPLGAIGLPALAIEEAAVGGLDQELIGVTAVGSHVGIETLVTELGNEQRVGAGRITVLDRAHVTSLVKIGGRGLRREQIGRASCRE